MTDPKNETIEATARESAFYEAGKSIGAAHATDAAAVMLTEMQQRLRAEPPDVYVWLAKAANEVASLAAHGTSAPNYKARVTALVDGLRASHDALLQRRAAQDDWLGECFASAQQVAGKHREAFAKQIAEMPPERRPASVGDSRTARKLIALFEALKK